MRLILASFLLTIFSFQILPIRAIGKILFKAQLTEELHEHEEDAEDADDPFSPEFFPKFNEAFPEFSTYRQRSGYMELRMARQTVAARQRSLFLEDQHYPDIFVPPPNA